MILYNVSIINSFCINKIRKIKVKLKINKINKENIKNNDFSRKTYY